MTAILHPAFPLLTAQELEDFNKVYDPSQFSSEEEWIRTATGEPELRCGVSIEIEFIIAIVHPSFEFEKLNFDEDNFADLRFFFVVHACRERRLAMLV